MMHTTAWICQFDWKCHVSVHPSGSRSGQIHHHDVRVADHLINRLTGHSQEVCGLQWSPDGRHLASGGNDNLVCVWPRVQEGGLGNNSQSIRCWSEHQGAVKVRLLTWIGFKLLACLTLVLIFIFFLFCSLSFLFPIPGFGMVFMATKHACLWRGHQWPSHSHLEREQWLLHQFNRHSVPGDHALLEPDGYVLLLW